MRPTDDKIAELSSIAGLAGHVLVGPNGELLSHDAPDAEALGALVAICRGGCSLVERELASSPAHSLSFHRGRSERFFVQPIGKNSLGFFLKKDAVGAEVLAQVAAWKDSLEV